MNTYMKLPLSTILKGNRFVVKRQREINEYKDKISTGNIVGQRYELVETNSYETIVVKIPEKTPSIPQIMIERASHPLMATLQTPMFSYYVNQGRLAISFTAEAITLLDDDDDDILIS